MHSLTNRHKLENKLLNKLHTPEVINISLSTVNINVSEVRDCGKLIQSLKPRLHERFFACDGDAIFLKIVASPARGENRMCSHPRTGDATDEKSQKKIARNSRS